MLTDGATLSSDIKLEPGFNDMLAYVGSGAASLSSRFRLI